MPSDKRSASRKHERPIENPDGDFQVDADCDKSKVECICPKSQKAHTKFSLDRQRHTPEILSKLPR